MLRNTLLYLSDKLSDTTSHSLVTIKIINRVSFFDKNITTPFIIKLFL